MVVAFADGRQLPGLDPYRETRAYVKKIQRLYRCNGGTGPEVTPEETIRLAAVVADGIFDISQRLDAEDLSTVRGSVAPSASTGALDAVPRGFTGASGGASLP